MSQADPAGGRPASAPSARRGAAAGWPILAAFGVLAALVAIAGRWGSPTELRTPGEANSVRLARLALDSVVTVVARVPADGFAGEDDPLTSSGFLYAPDLVATNYHAVAGASAIQVGMRDGRELRADLAAADEGLDLALLRIAPQTIEPLRLGSSGALAPGQSLLVLGAPGGMRGSVSEGVFGSLSPVSLNDGAPGTEIPELIVTDAVIREGSSGGPVLDSDGHVVGVVVANLSAVASTAAGLGLAIPSDVASPALADLARFGAPRRGRLAAVLSDLSDVDPLVLRSAGLEGSAGAIVEAVDPDSAAGRAGLRGATRAGPGLVALGDVILAVDGTSVGSAAEATREIGGRRPGSTVELRLWRDGTARTVRVRVEARQR